MCTRYVLAPRPKHIRGGRARCIGESCSGRKWKRGEFTEVGHIQALGFGTEGDGTIAEAYEHPRAPSVGSCSDGSLLGSISGSTDLPQATPVSNQGIPKPAYNHMDLSNLPVTVAQAPAAPW